MYDSTSNTYTYETKVEDKEIRISINEEEKWIIVIEETGELIERWNYKESKNYSIEYYKNNNLLVKMIEDKNCIGNLCENNNRVKYFINEYYTKLIE